MDRPDGLLFDLDGTLVDTAPLFERCYVETLRLFGAAVNVETFRELYARGLTDAQFLAALDLDPGRGPDLFEASLARYLESLRSEARWYEDALEVIEVAADRIPIAVVTSATRASIDALDAKLGVRARVGVLIDRTETGGVMKPDPRPLLLGVERLGLSAANCRYVGDQPSDMLAARAAAMPNCLIRRDHTPDSALAHADRVITDLRELLRSIL